MQNGRPGKYSRAEAKAYAREKIRGIFCAFVLPETPDHQIDEAGLRRDIRHYIDVIKVGGLYVHGFYGNFWLLTVPERKRVTEIAVEEARGQVPVLVRCAHPCLKDVIDLVQHAESVGADFISMIGPQLASGSVDMIFRFFEEVAASTNLGISVFNTVQAGYTISPETMAKLAEIPNIVALKNDGEMSETIRIRQLAGDGIVVVDPNEVNFHINMLHFGQQAIYTGTNMMYDHAEATPMLDYVTAGLRGDAQRCVELYYKMQPLRDLHRRWIVEPWKSKGVCPVARIKYWTELNGLAGGGVRPPLTPITEAERAELRVELETLGALPRPTLVGVA